ncbi:YitT family protein [Alkalihalophilus sp. As8PL]|uniref:YitT family protein n=2 Tax=Alkalihalophilus TaxID=2893060 RepID=A0AB39BPW8_9BACI|nr:YitT family protein [Alkalihalophilus lindianensis]MDV2684585.1 YitT family protein [Alkalihalophilus lindianensis]
MKKWLMILLAIVITSFGVILLKHANIVTGGTAGLSLSIAYFFSLPFGVTFFLINIPFYIFSMMRMGWNFTFTTIISVSLLSLVTGIDYFLPAFSVSVWVGAIVGGFIIGVGLSLLFMNGSSLGGANILALFLQKRWNIDPGKTTFAFDFIVVMTGFYTVGLVRGLASILSIAVIARVISYFKNEIAKRGTDAAAKEKEKNLKAPTKQHIPVAE